MAWSGLISFEGVVTNVYLYSVILWLFSRGVSRVAECDECPKQWRHYTSLG